MVKFLRPETPKLGISANQLVINLLGLNLLLNSTKCVVLLIYIYFGSEAVGPTDDLWAPLGLKEFPG